MPIHLNDCSALDHCNHWIFDGATDLTNTSWGGSSEVWGGSFPPKRCLDKTLTEEGKGERYLASGRQYGNALLGVRHQEEDFGLHITPNLCLLPPAKWRAQQHKLGRRGATRDNGHVDDELLNDDDDDV